MVNNSDGSTVPEPNQMSGAENCGVANSSQVYGKAWGWSDTDCMAQGVSICKYMREWRAGLQGQATCHEL
jgi:hypothetical protein